MVFSLGCSASAAGLKLNVEEKGTYIYWLGYTDGLGASQVTEPERFKGKSADVDVNVIGSTAKNVKLFVMDKKSGNMAVADYKPPKDPKQAKPIDLKKDDFSYVRSVKLRAVAENNQPIESGIVSITDGEGTAMSAVVTPADAGVALFENVAAGEINVKVKAKGVTKTLESDFELPSSRPEPGFERDVKVAGDVDTVAAPVAAASGHKAAKPQRSTGIGGVLQFISGLLFLIVLIAIVVVVLKAKGVTAKGALQNMGVQLPGEDDTVAAPGAPAAPAVDPNKCPFCGQIKDAAGRCACSVTPGGSPFAAPAAAGGTGPRLIGTQGVFAGHVFEISGGSATIGREDGNTVALSGDNTASRHHATITVMGAECSIRDEGSSNGTFVNGAKITEQKLTPGDEVQIGGSKFRFEV